MYYLGDLKSIPLSTDLISDVKGRGCPRPNGYTGARLVSFLRISLSGPKEKREK